MDFDEAIVMRVLVLVTSMVISSFSMESPVLLLGIDSGGSSSECFAVLVSEFSVNGF